MKGPASAGVDGVGPAAVRLADGPPEGIGLRRHEDQLNVVRHQALSPYLDASLERLLGQQIAVDLLAAFLEEDGFAPVATLRDVVRKTRNHNVRQSSHG